MVKSDNTDNKINIAINIELDDVNNNNNNKTQLKPKCCICMEEGKKKKASCKICKACLICNDCKDKLKENNMINKCPICRETNWIKENNNYWNCFNSKHNNIKNQDNNSQILCNANSEILKEKTYNLILFLTRIIIGFLILMGLGYLTILIFNIDTESKNTGLILMIYIIYGMATAFVIGVTLCVVSMIFMCCLIFKMESLER